MNTLSEELKEVLTEAGAKLVGYGDLSEVENARGYATGVSVALPVPVSILKEIADGPICFLLSFDFPESPKAHIFMQYLHIAEAHFLHQPELVVVGYFY